MHIKRFKKISELGYFYGNLLLVGGFRLSKCRITFMYTRRNIVICTLYMYVWNFLDLTIIYSSNFQLDKSMNNNNNKIYFQKLQNIIGKYILKLILYHVEETDNLMKMYK